MRRIFSVGIAFFAAFVFSGCGNGGTSSDATSPVPPVVSEIEAPPMPEPMENN